MEKQQESRREFVKKAAYITPAILTLAVAPSYAKAGSYKGPGHGQDNNGKGNNGKGKGNNGKGNDNDKGQGNKKK